MFNASLKQFGIGSAFFMFILLAAGLAKALVGPTVVVASESPQNTSAVPAAAPVAAPAGR